MRGRIQNAQITLHRFNFKKPVKVSIALPRRPCCLDAGVHHGWCIQRLLWVFEALCLRFCAFTFVCVAGRRVQSMRRFPGSHDRPKNTSACVIGIRVECISLRCVATSGVAVAWSQERLHGLLSGQGTWGKLSFDSARHNRAWPMGLAIAHTCVASALPPCRKSRSRVRYQSHKHAITRADKLLVPPPPHTRSVGVTRMR